MNDKVAEWILDETQERLCYLADRWANECEYENWTDYSNSMAAIVNGLDGVRFLDMQKRPFGFRCAVERGDTERIYRVYLTQQQIIVKVE